MTWRGRRNGRHRDWAVSGGDVWVLQWTRAMPCMFELAGLLMVDSNAIQALLNDKQIMQQWIVALLPVLPAIVVAYLTYQLAQSTKDYAITAREQLKEITRARLITIQPYVHVSVALLRHRNNLRFHNIALNMKLVNIGNGPAFNIRVRLYHDLIEFLPYTKPLLLNPGEQAQVDIPETRGGHGLAPGQTFPNTVTVLIEYKDIVERWWATTASLGLEANIGVDGVVVAGVALHDVEEQVKQIPGPTLRHGLMPPIMTGY